VTNVVQAATPMTVAACKMVGYDDSVCDSIEQGAKIYNQGAQIVNMIPSQQIQQLGFWGDVKKGFNDATKVVNQVTPVVNDVWQMVDPNSH
jgi:hypothetical protein